jgi:hypothetical protein
MQDIVITKVTIKKSLEIGGFFELTVSKGMVIFPKSEIADLSDQTCDLAASSRGVLPEVDRSHPSGSFFSQDR